MIFLEPPKLYYLLAQNVRMIFHSSKTLKYFLFNQVPSPLRRLAANMAIRFLDATTLNRFLETTVIPICLTRRCVCFTCSFFPVFPLALLLKSSCKVHLLGHVPSSTTFSFNGVQYFPFIPHTSQHFVICNSMHPAYIQYSSVSPQFKAL